MIRAFKRTLCAFSAFAAVMLLSLNVSADASVCRSVPNDNKQIALTFDDGPHPKYTPEILEILDDAGVKATFFMIGSNAEKYPELVREVSLRGHEIGNHTYSHKALASCSDKKIADELSRAQKIITDITGIAPTVFRPPGGSYSDRAISVIKGLGFTPILWSQDSSDWRMPSTDKIISNVTTSVNGGDIFLFHDFNRNPSPTPAAVREVITRLKDEGYSFVTVSELLSMK